jgi:hypothetical protein
MISHMRKNQEMELIKIALKKLIKEGKKEYNNHHIDKNLSSCVVAFDRYASSFYRHALIGNCKKQAHNKISNHACG